MTIEQAPPRKYAADFAARHNISAEESQPDVQVSEQAMPDAGPVFSRQSGQRPLPRMRMPVQDEQPRKLPPEEVEAMRMRVPEMAVHDPRSTDTPTNRGQTTIRREQGKRDDKPQSVPYQPPRNERPRQVRSMEDQPPPADVRRRASVDAPPLVTPEFKFDQPPTVTKLGGRGIFHYKASQARSNKGQIDSRYKRQRFPSRGLPYGFAEVNIRPFEVPELIGLYDAVTNKSESAFYDVCDNCIDVDVRDLTPPDFRWLMYWWRLNSYTKSPWIQPWTSRYGNHQVLHIHESELVVREIEATEDQVRFYTDMGIDFPRLREVEFMADQTGWDKVDVYLANRAQYLKTTEFGERWWLDRIERLMSGGISLMESIRDFINLTDDYGVREVATVRDGAFVAADAVDYLRRQAELIASVTLVQPDLSDQYVLEQNERVDDYYAEAEAIEAAIEAGEPVGPREEVIVLSISTMDFFPAI